MSVWISTKYRDANENVDYVVVDENGVVAVARYWAAINRWLSSDARSMQGAEVTHYMPIPAIPNKG